MVIWAVQGDQHGFWRVGLVVVPAAFACTYAVAIALRRLEFDLRWKRNPGHN